MTEKIVQPTKYRYCTIAPVNGGFDVFEGSSRWFHVKTQKQAKWWASISARLNDACMANLPKPVPAAIEDHTPKAKATTA